MFEQLMKQNEAMMKQFQTMMGADALAQMMKPYTNLLEMQRSVIESITEEQTRVATELMNDYLEEARQVCSCNSLPEAVEIQKAYFVYFCTTRSRFLFTVTASSAGCAVEV